MTCKHLEGELHFVAMFLEMREGELGVCFQGASTTLDYYLEKEESRRNGIHCIVIPTVNTLKIPTQIKPGFGANDY